MLVKVMWRCDHMARLGDATKGPPLWNRTKSIGIRGTFPFQSSGQAYIPNEVSSHIPECSSLP